MSLPSTKATKYDRQLRLWGDHGQAALESAHVCLINASATGTETVKNLVLPGIGGFTVVDNKRVSPEDVGSNFFLTADTVGTPRAQVAVALLQELNPEVKGAYIDDDFQSILETTPDFFSQFTAVIATELSDESLLKLAQVVWKSETPLLVARAYGLLGYLRIAIPHHEIVESHPDNYHEDVRLDCPFPGLLRYMNGINLDALDNTKHGNVPYLVVLFKYLEVWRESHGGEIPQNYREKKEFKELIRSGIRKNEDGVPLDEDNFDEAIRNVNSMINPTQVPSTVQAILEDSACTCITPESSNFWLLARALREFVVNEGSGRLPLRGSIPDMTSSSNMYVDLQRVYQAQAREDMEVVASHLSELLVSIGKPSNSISESDIKQFCRNSAFLRVVRYRSLIEEYQIPNLDEIRMHLENQDSDLVYYILLRAAEQFYSMYKSYPGEKGNAFESDVAQMKSTVASLLQQWGASMYSIPDEHITEFCRYGAGEIHSVAAFLGGVASQEVIKLITHQFVPLNSTFMYEGCPKKIKSSKIIYFAQRAL